MRRPCRRPGRPAGRRRLLRRRVPSSRGNRSPPPRSSPHHASPSRRTMAPPPRPPGAADDVVYTRYTSFIHIVYSYSRCTLYSVQNIGEKKTRLLYIFLAQITCLLRIGWPTKQGQPWPYADLVRSGCSKLHNEG